MSLEVSLLEELRNKRLTCAVAESCTGGRICDRMTAVPGSSETFLGGVIAYANSAKMSLLSVPEESLTIFGAVSPEVAQAMSQGAVQRFQASVGISTTGIAGPGGGSPNKPVGLTYIAISGPDGFRCERHVFPGDRNHIKTRGAKAALKALLCYVKGLANSP